MRVELPSGTPAELARPDGEPTRGLALMPDIGGLRPLFDDLCADLADRHGWAVCAPEPFPGREGMTLQERLETGMPSLVDDEVLADLAAAADATGCERVGVLGFCMGGMYALKAAAHGRFDRVVAFYGMIRIPEQWQAPGQGEPLDALRADGAVPALHIAGTEDPWTPAADLEAAEAAGVEVVRYEGADHGFVHDPDRPTHRPDDAADAWSRAVAFLTP